MTLPPTDLPAWMRPRRRRIDWGLLFVMAIGLLLNWPLAFWSGLPGNTDAALFVARAMEIADSLRSGVLYTRWAADFHFGYGSPLFNFLAPLPHYLSGLHQLITDANPIDSIKLWLAVSVVMAGVGMYHFARRRYGLRAGLIAAVVYMSSTPIAYALPIQSGNLAMLLSLALLPWMLWAVDRLIAQPTRAQWLITVAALVAWGLADTRLTLIGLPLLGIVLIGARQKRRSRMAVWWLLSVAVLITAFFWLPALVERSDVQWVPLANDPLGSAISLTESLGTIPVNSPGVLNPPVARGLGLGFSVTVILGAAAFIRSAPARRKLPGEVIAFGAVGLAGLLLTTPLAANLWLPPDSWQGWQPIRPYDLLLGAALPALTIIAAQAARWWSVAETASEVVPAARKPLDLRRRAVGIALLCLPTLATLLPTLSSPAWLPARSLDAPLSSDTETTINAIGTLRTGLLLPLPAHLPDAPLDNIVFNSPKHAPNPVSGLLLISRTSLESRFSLSSLPVTQPSPPLTLDRLAFPGWSVTVDNAAVADTVSSDGLIRFDLANPSVMTPNAEVLLVFGDTPIRYAAWLLTISGLLLLGGRTLFMPTTLLFGDRLFNGADEWRRVDVVLLGLLLGVLAILTAAARLTPDSRAAGTAADSTAITAITGTPTASYPAAVVATRYESAPLVPGATAQIVLFWRALRPISADWQLVARLVPAMPDLTAANLAASPILATQWQPGNIPTSDWTSQLLIRDPLLLTIPAATTPGSYHVQVALAQCDSLQRLPCERPTPISPTGTQAIAPWLTLPDTLQIGPR